MGKSRRKKVISSDESGREDSPEATPLRVIRPVVGSGVDSLRTEVVMEGSPICEEIKEQFTLSPRLDLIHIDSWITEFGLPTLGYEYRAPVETDRAYAPPAGFITVFLFSLQGGFRIPLLPFQEEFIQKWDVLPCFLLPNAWRVLNSFSLVCLHLQIKATMDLFLALFKCYTSPEGGVGFSARRSSWLKHPTSTHPNKSQFMFVKPVDGYWNFKTDWRAPNLPTGSVAVTSTLEKSIKLIKNFAQKAGVNGKLESLTYSSLENLAALGSLPSCECIVVG